jgi:hypothetical protein
VPPGPQRSAEGGYPLEQAGVVLPGRRGRGDSSGVNVLDPDSGVQFGVVGLAWIIFLGVHGHLVTVAGEFAGELAQAHVITVRA